MCDQVDGEEFRLILDQLSQLPGMWYGAGGGEPGRRIWLSGCPGGRVSEPLVDVEAVGVCFWVRLVPRFLPHWLEERCLFFIQYHR